MRTTRGKITYAANAYVRPSARIHGSLRSESSRITKTISQTLKMPKHTTRKRRSKRLISLKTFPSHSRHPERCRDGLGFVGIQVMQQMAVFCASGTHVPERTLRAGSRKPPFSTRPDLNLNTPETSPPTAFARRGPCSNQNGASRPLSWKYGRLAVRHLLWSDQGPILRQCLEAELCFGGGHGVRGSGPQHVRP